MTNASPGTAKLRVLLVASEHAPVQAAAAVVDVLQATDVELRMVDVGRIEARRRGSLSKVLHALAGEGGGLKLTRELANHPPEVTLALDPATTAALCLAREDGKSLAVVVAVVSELAPTADWAESEADRYLVVDDDAAVTLADHGVPGERVLPVGALVTRLFADAARQSKASLRTRFKLATPHVVLVDVDGMGYKGAQQLALQLALGGPVVTTLFDAGKDKDAATALRHQVPALGMKAKLFGDTDDAPMLWRAADVIVAAPTGRNIARAMALGARFVALKPEGPVQEQAAAALVARKLGAVAQTTLLLSSTLEDVWKLPDVSGGRDGASTLAEAVVVMGWDREGVLGEASEEQLRAEREAAERATAERVVNQARSTAEQRMSSAAGGLEDLSGFGLDLDGDQSGPALGDVAQRKAGLSVRIEQAKKRVFQARGDAERWDKRVGTARDKGQHDLARQAERSADAERRKMHAALQELAALEKEGKQLDEEAAAAAVREAQRSSAAKAASSQPRPRTSPRAHATRSSLDAELASMKARQTKTRKSVDDELAALKAKMTRKGK